MPLYGLELTFLLHDAADAMRRVVHEAAILGTPPESVQEALQSHLARLTAAVLNLPSPCGERFSDSGLTCFCERERGHPGRHIGNL